MLFSLWAFSASRHLSCVTSSNSGSSARQLDRDHPLCRLHMLWTSSWSRRAQAYKLESMGRESGKRYRRGWAVSGIGESAGLYGYKGRSSLRPIERPTPTCQGYDSLGIVGWCLLIHAGKKERVCGLGTGLGER